MGVPLTPLNGPGRRFELQSDTPARLKVSKVRPPPAGRRMYACGFVFPPSQAKQTSHKSNSFPRGDRTALDSRQARQLAERAGPEPTPAPAGTRPVPRAARAVG